MSRQPSQLPQARDVLQGTLDLLILRTLATGPRHGWSIAKRIQELSKDVLRINQGSLYPALYRLEDRGWIAAEWGVSSEGRRAKFYRLSAAGRKRLTEETREWREFSVAINLVLEGA
jgi:PadR family transcriptional regulator PadR